MISPHDSEGAFRDVAADYENSLKKGLRRTARQITKKYHEFEDRLWYSVYICRPSAFADNRQDARTCKRKAARIRARYGERTLGPKHMTRTFMSSVFTFRWLYGQPQDEHFPPVPPVGFPPWRSNDEIAAALIELEERLWYRHRLDLIADLESGAVKLGSNFEPGIIPRSEFEQSTAAASFLQAKYSQEMLERMDPGADGELTTLRWLYGHEWGDFTFLIEHPGLPLPDAMTEEVRK